MVPSTLSRLKNYKSLGSLSWVGTTSVLYGVEILPTP